MFFVTHIFQHLLKLNAAATAPSFFLIPRNESNLTFQSAAPFMRLSALHFITSGCFGLG